MSLGRLGTWWWNLRFDLGRQIGGFTRVEREYFVTTYSTKLWVHGRLRQLARRASCVTRGHRWSDWSETTRVCRLGCGGVQYGGPVDGEDAS